MFKTKKALYGYLLVGTLAIVAVAWAATIELTSTPSSGFKISDFNQIKTMINGLADDILTAFPVDSLIGDTVDDDVLDQPQINIINDTTTEIPMTIKEVASQTADNLKVTDSNDVTLLEFLAGGGFSNKEGMRTVTTQFGAGLGVQLYGEDVPEHTNQSGWYDHAGGTQDMLFTKTSGDAFTQEDADDGTHILLTNFSGAFPMAEIKEYISATQVVVHGYCWDDDIGSGGSPLTFLSLSHPSFISADCAEHEFSVEDTGSFEVHSYDFTGTYVAEFELDSAADGTDTVLVKAEAHGYNGVQAGVFDYQAGDLQPGDTGGAIGARVDVSGAASADATTEVDAFIAVVVNGSGATTTAYRALPGFTNFLSVVGSTIKDMDYGYTVDSGVVTDRTAAFAATGTNVVMFAADNDYVVYGDDDTFEIINVVLAVAASNLGVLPSFEYSTGNGTWSILTLASDGTTGYSSNGPISFDAPGDWAKGNQLEAPADITSAYLVRVTRTRNTLPQVPTESIMRIYESRDLGMYIRGDGVVKHPYLGAAPSNLVNGMEWMEADGKHVYYNGTERLLSDGAP